MTPLGEWLSPWEPSPTVVIATAAVAVFYLRGCARIPASFLRRFCFWLGLLMLYAMCHTQFDYYAEHAFFMHRIQHTLLHHIGPFLIALSRPKAALLAGMPKVWRAQLRSAAQWPPLRSVIDLLNHPLMAASLFCGLIMFWLLPAVHFYAMLDWRLYRLMNWGMAINGLMFWSLALNNFCLRPAQLSAARRIALMLAVIPPQIAIGMVIFAAPRDLYPLYSLCGRVFLHIAPLADQQIGGLILWIPAAMMSVAGVLTVIAREWITSGKKEFSYPAVVPVPRP